MNLQTRKLNIIEYLISIQDVKVFSKIESTILDISQLEKQKIKTFTQKKLIERAKRSNDDYLAGRVKSQSQLEKESENW